MRLLTSLTVFLAASISLAVVDMKNANYADTWLDLTVPGTGFDLKVQRTYNSRSIFNGIFGFGWCSDFETTLEVTIEGNLEITECGGGLEITYFPESHDAGEVKQTVEEILKRVKAKNRSLGNNYINTLRGQLIQDNELRAIWAKEVGLKAQSNKVGVIYLANGQEVDRIVFDGKMYTRELPDGTRQKFDTAGRLNFFYDKNRNYIKLTHKGKHLSEVVDNNGRKLSFVYGSDGKLREVRGPNGLKAEYQFKSEDLVSVKNAWNNAYQYAYDSLHNLTRIQFPDNTFKALTYDEKRDWVTSFRDRNACVETYSYIPSKKDPKNEYASKAEKKCDGKVVNSASHEFWHKTRNDGKKFLYRVRTTNKREAVDIVYHEVYGKPVSVKRGGSTTNYSYYQNGLLKSQSTPEMRIDYRYKNSYRKVSDVEISHFNKKGKLVKKQATTYQYDKRGNLTFARNSDGQAISIKYDVRGRIVQLVDQAKKVVQISYDDRFGKPEMISRPEVGSIRVQYKSNGEIDKISSKEGTSVAVQVASTFNHLLDIISPATSDLSL